MEAKEETAFKEGDFVRRVVIDESFGLTASKPCTLAIGENEIRCAYKDTEDRISLGSIGAVEINETTITFVMKDSKRYTIEATSKEIIASFSKAMKSRNVGVRAIGMNEHHHLPSPPKLTFSSPKCGLDTKPTIGKTDSTDTHQSSTATSANDTSTTDFDTPNEPGQPIGNSADVNPPNDSDDDDSDKEDSDDDDYDDDGNDDPADYSMTIFVPSGANDVSPHEAIPIYTPDDFDKILEKEIESGTYEFRDGELDEGRQGELIFDYDSNSDVWSRNEACRETSFSVDGLDNKYTIFMIPAGCGRSIKIVYVSNEKRWCFLKENNN